MTEQDKNLEKLYQKQIIRWWKNPHHQKDIACLQDVVTEKNPMCGDSVSVGRFADNDDLYWNGEGCMICLAAAEAFCEGHNRGDMTLDDADKILEDYHKNGDIVQPFKAFQSVKNIPQRIGCVTLVAKAVRKLIPS